MRAPRRLLNCRIQPGPFDQPGNHRHQTLQVCIGLVYALVKRNNKTRVIAESTFQSAKPFINSQSNSLSYALLNRRFRNFRLGFRFLLAHYGQLFLHNCRNQARQFLAKGIQLCIDRRQIHWRG